MVACILVMVGSGLVSADWGSIPECAAAYSNLTQTLSDWQDNYYSLKDNFNNQHENLSNCFYRLNNEMGNYSQYQLTATSCTSQVAAVQNISLQKDTQITSLTADKTACRSDLKKAQDTAASASSDAALNVKTAEDKVSFLNDQVMTAHNQLNDVQNQLSTCSINLNDSNLKQQGLCQDFVASHYYSMWQQLDGSQKDCLDKVLQHDTVSLMTTDPKTNMLSICGLNFQTGINYMTVFLEKGFLEKDPSTNYMLDSNLPSDYKSYMNLAGNFHPVVLTRGCIKEYRDRDTLADDSFDSGMRYGVGVLVLVAAFTVAAYSWYNRIHNSS